MSKVKVIYNREGCIGAAACVTVSPRFWKLVEDGKADLIGGKINQETGRFELEIEADEATLRELKDSADSCPVQVIEVIEEK